MFTDKPFTEDLRPVQIDGIYYMVVTTEDYSLTPEQHDEGFWPSLDKDDPGYVEPQHFSSALSEAKIRRMAFDSNQWHYIDIAIIAEVNLNLPGYAEKTISLGTVASMGGIELDDKQEILETINRFLLPDAIKHTRSIINNLALLIQN
jgi:hypothetical protein